MWPLVWLDCDTSKFSRERYLGTSTQVRPLSRLLWANRSIALDINWRGPRIAPARRARAKYTFLQIWYSPLRRTSHHSGGPWNFDTRVFLVPAARSHMSACFYRTRKTQRVRDLSLVFWAPSWACLIHIKAIVPYCTIVKKQIIVLWILSDWSSETGFGQPSPSGSQMRS
jgi:hypothetical protein